MNLRLALVGVLVFSSGGYTQTALTQKQSCAKFMSAVVRIDVADGKATGFIVSEDGWILTAGHVVFNTQTGERRDTIDVSLPDGSSQLAQIMIDKESVIRDFAILKVEKHGLPFLELGDAADVAPGSNVTIIGFPFSAEYNGSGVNTKFCLSGMVAATESVTKFGVNVDAIYFQGPAVKGISGAPVISLDTGRVIGIQSEKLAGITSALNTVRNNLHEGQNAGSRVIITGADFGPTMIDLINVLDNHLVNGLGAATAIDDPKFALSKAKRAMKAKH